MTGFRKALLLALASGALAALPAAAQQTGAIVGKVTERASGNPVPDANVFIVGTPRGARTTTTGEYRITGVSAGTFEVRVTRIGYTAVTRSVTSAGSGEVTADFQITPAAVQIEQVLVTATGATERKRENGNDVAIVKPGDNTSLAATPTLVQALAGKAAGLTITQSSGTPGSSSRIRIRGANSVSLSNDPLLIIDGVRVDNNSNGIPNFVGGQTTSRFDDINPEEIESIEILKGPAASAMYGTAAANGVLQITTKRGRAGRTQWRGYVDYGKMYDPTKYPDNYFTIGHTATGNYAANCTLDRRTQGVCIADSTFKFNPLDYYNVLGTGNQTDYGLSATGGADAAQYYIAGDFQRAQGIVQPSQTHNVNLRANVNARFRQNLTAQITTSYIDRHIRLPINDNNIYGVVPNGILGHAANCNATANGAKSGGAFICGADTLSRGFYSVPPSSYYFMNNFQDVKRFIGGANITWQPLSWLSAVGQGGIDMDNNLSEQIVPSNVVTYINSTIANGYINEYRYQIPDYSASGTLTATKTFQSVQTTTSVGSQLIEEQSHYTYAFGRNLIPGTYSLSGVGAGAQVNESNQTVITLGNYAREQLAWRDRAFLTGAIRADRNSAFGTRVTWAYYPSFSGSYVLSEEPFFRDHVGDWLNELRVRAAYGQSGQRPAFRQAETYLNAQSVLTNANAELPGVVIGGTGNLQLRPEISVEDEGGFDASFLNNKVGLTYTYYHKTTRDALIAAVLAPSIGLSNSYYRNLGRVENSGNELTLNVTPLDVHNTKLDIAISGSTNKNRLKSLGKDAAGKPIPAIFFNPQRFQEGYPLGAYFQRKYKYSDANGNGIIERSEVTLLDTASAAQYIGPALPTTEVSITPTLTYRAFRLSALFNHRGGNYLYNNTEEFRCGSSSFSMCDAVNDPKASQAVQAAAIAKNTYGTSYGFIEKADFWKLRELSATASLPARWAGKMGASSLAITVAGRNLKTWSDYRGFDPEIQGASNNANFTTFDFLTQPPLRQWSLRLDMNF